MSLLHGTLMAPYFSQDKSQNFWSWHQVFPLPPLTIVFTITFMYRTVLPDFFSFFSFLSAPHTFKFWWKRSPGLRNLNCSGFWFCPLCYVLCEAISNHSSSKAISGLTTIVHDLYQSNNIYFYLMGFPGGFSKESACTAGDLGSIPGLGRSPGEGNGNPLQCSCLGNPIDRGAWWATVHRVARIGMTYNIITYEMLAECQVLYS